MALVTQLVGKFWGCVLGLHTPCFTAASAVACRGCLSASSLVCLFHLGCIVLLLPPSCVPNLVVWLLLWPVNADSMLLVPLTDQPFSLFFLLPLLVLFFFFFFFILLFVYCYCKLHTRMYAQFFLRSTVIPLTRMLCLLASSFPACITNRLFPWHPQR